MNKLTRRLLLESAELRGRPFEDSIPICPLHSKRMVYRKAENDWACGCIKPEIPSK